MEINRINKTRARKAYNNGKDILVFPCHLRPDFFGIVINNRGGRDFDKVINEFEYYNCSNSETGRYAAYIIN